MPFGQLTGRMRWCLPVLTVGAAGGETTGAGWPSPDDGSAPFLERLELQIGPASPEVCPEATHADPKVQPVGRMSTQVGFVGRERELQVLDQQLAAAAMGRPQVVFVEGEAGAGKSALLTRFLDSHSDSRRSLPLVETRRKRFWPMGLSIKWEQAL